MEILKIRKKSRWFFLAGLVLCLGLSSSLLVSCDSGGNLLSGDTNEETQLSETGFLAPNIKLQISYNQKAMTFKRFWPEDMVGGLSKSKVLVDGSQELLVAYENTHETEAFDNQRYFYSDTRYVEGNDAINMPATMFQELSGEMPDRSSDQIVTNRVKLANGTITFWRVDGSVVSESVPMDSLRMDTDAFDAMVEELQGPEQSPIQQVQHNLKMMQDSGINFKEVGNNYISYDLEDNASEGDDDIGVIKQVMDLKTGEIVISAIMLKDGRYDSITLMDYETQKGLNVMANSETLQFGMLNGEWAVVQRSLINRSNIDVKINL